MAVSVKAITLWRAEVDNRPGTLAKALGPLAESGASLRVAMAYRFPGKREPRRDRALPGLRKKGDDSGPARGTLRVGHPDPPRGG